MYKDYISINGTTIASDEKGMHQIETTDKIGKELTLENEIEIIETNIALIKKEKEKLGTVEENQKLIKKCYMIAIAMIIGVSALVKFCFPIISPTIELPKQLLPFIKTNTDFTFYMMILVSLFFTTPFSIFFPRESKNRIDRIQSIEEQLEFLNNELAKKREELEELRTHSKKESITDTTIHSVDNNRYRASLKERLDLLSYIKKYKDNLNKHLANGTLDEELNKLEIKPENIPFVKETLMRVLEKKEK